MENIKLCDQAVPCKRCGEKTYMIGTKLCNNCWEVEHRLDWYLASEGGREHLARLLKEAQASVEEESVN